MALVNQKVILPLIRRVMPNLIASQLVGVQPMTGPIGSIFGLSRGTYYGMFEMKKKHYQHFLKAYNRRSKQTESYLVELGYTCVRINLPEDNCDSARAYCNRYVKDGAWVTNGGYFIFAYDNKDATMFALKFA